MLAIAQRYWFIVLLCAVLCGGAAVTWALQRPPKYLAEARVGALNLRLQNVTAIPGVLDAANDLTTLYARAVPTDPVLGPVAKANDMTIQEVTDAVTATPLADSPIVRISSEAKSEKLAVALADGTATSLVKFVRSQSGLADSVAKELEKYRKLQLRASELQEDEAAARNTLTLADTETNRQRVADAAAATAEAQMLADAQQTAYQTTLQNREAALTPVKLVAAGALGNDRLRTAQLAGFAGVIAGGLIGLAIAGMLAAGRRREQG